MISIKERFYNHRILLALGGAAILLALLALGYSLIAIQGETGSLSAEQVALARAGVRDNNDWQPVLRRFSGIDMALVPAGCFNMGTSEAQIAEAFDSCERFFGAGKCRFDFTAIEGPDHQVCFNEPYWIGETEVTNRQYGSSSSTNMETMYRGASWPRETVTWSEAQEFCQSLGARLPTEAEWEYAARGPDNLLYPWGNQFDPEILASGMLSPRDVGSFPAGASWVGALDMSGGVAEWVVDWYGPYSQHATTDPQGPPYGQQRITRGGSWFSFAAFSVRTAHREPLTPETHNSTIGFRCARDFER